MENKIRNGLIIILIIFLLIIARTNLFNVSMKDSSQSGISNMSQEEIKKLLISHTERISLLVESIQKIPQEIALIMEFQKIRMEEIDIVQNSILLNSPELFGTALAFEPYAFKKDALYFSSYLYREENAIRHITLDGPEYEYFYKEWYLMPKLLQKPIWSIPYYDDGGGGVFMTSYSVPFYSFDGAKETFAGISTVDVSIDWLANYFMTNKRMPGIGSLILISEDGTIISAPQKEWIMNETIFTLALALNIPDLREVGRDLQKGNSGAKKIINPSTKRKTTIFYSAISANKWGLIYLIPEESSLKGDFNK